MPQRIAKVPENVSVPIDNLAVGSVTALALYELYCVCVN